MNGAATRPSIGETAFRSHAGSQRDLREILLDIAEDSPDTAERLRSDFYEGLRMLGRSPALVTFTMNF